ncbi:MAG: hypothetical protein D6790_11015 [Caldilineae bacterium]|nr:MAG: hypothetical protein D6790_11015 [Caldilineae bacterium]
MIIRCDDLPGPSSMDDQGFKRNHVRDAIIPGSTDRAKDQPNQPACSRIRGCMARMDQNRLFRYRVQILDIRAHIRSRCDEHHTMLGPGHRQ